MADYKLSPEEAEKLLRDLETDEKEENAQIVRDMFTEFRRTFTSKFAGFLLATFVLLMTVGIAIAASAFLIRKALGY
jgi:hypothetical protein